MGLFKRRPQDKGDNTMTVPTKVEVNCATGVVTEVPLSDAEIAQLEADRVAFQAQKAQRDAEEAAKAAAVASAEAKLAALGLTADEIAAIK